MSSGELTTRPSESTELSVDVVLGRLDKIQELMKRAMTPNVDYGTIPGTNSKPTLLKPGAEKLCVLFRFAPKLETKKHFHTDGHMTVECTCQILDMQGNFLGEASAMCSTKEAKYAYRRSNRKCPNCGAEAILKSKFPPRDDPSAAPGWYCFAKKGGCGKNFDAGDHDITSQSEGRVPNEDLADSFNTVVRIAEKRALLGAVRLVTGSSGMFDEEIPGQTERDPDPERHEAPAKAAAPKAQPAPDAKIMAEWEPWFVSDPNCEAVNARLPEIARDSGMDPWTRTALWTRIKHSADLAGWTFSGGKFSPPNNATFGADSPLEESPAF